MAGPFKVIAHRGFSSKAPENTMAAFDLAVKSGFDNIELDVQLCKEDVVVVFHDDTLERTANRHSLISNTSLKDLKKLDVGQNQQIPTLEQVLKHFANKAHLHIELKSRQENLAYQVASLLMSVTPSLIQTHKYNPYFVPGLTITSFHLEQLERSLQKLSSVDHHWLVDSINDVTIQQSLALGITGLCPRAKLIKGTWVKKAEQADITVRAWGVQSHDDLIKVMLAGASGATVNWPDEAKKLLYMNVEK